MQKYELRAAFIGVFVSYSFRFLVKEGIVRFLINNVIERLKPNSTLVSLD